MIPLRLWSIFSSAFEQTFLSHYPHDALSLLFEPEKMKERERGVVEEEEDIAIQFKIDCNRVIIFSLSLSFEFSIPIQLKCSFSLELKYEAEAAVEKQN
jgi:hypothetical protein